jgi:pimeloyl-ACP methyl ester carboxylesterase
MYGDPARIGEGCVRDYMNGLRVRGTIPHILEIVRVWSKDLAKLQAALPRIADIPTLLVWGDRDRAVSVASGERLRKECRAVELVVVPGGGHVVFEEMPEESNRILLQWLRAGSTIGGGVMGRIAIRV